MPNIFSAITQRDRQNLFVANLLNLLDERFLGLGDLFGVDFRYSQIGYSSALGVEYIYTNFHKQKCQQNFTERVEGSQVLYDVKIYDTKSDHFNEVNLQEQNSTSGI
ncbi:hypothetical protein VB002_01880 [Campylobacter concisus]